MDKYVIISDPIRSKEFAIVGELEGSIVFKPLNEMAKVWAKENSHIKSLNAMRVPDGMHVSSPRRMTTSMSIIVSPASSYENVENNTEEKFDISSVKSGNIFSGRKIKNLNKIKSVNNIEIRKVSRISKMNLIDYKASSFSNRAKRSSVIGVIRSGVGRMNPKSASISSRANSSIEILSKTAGSSFVRRVAVSNFISERKNRINRRSSNLSSMSSSVDNNRDYKSTIDMAISSKAKRFI
jgi:hypothetical protein